jgi:hypothetical protein
MASEPQGEIGQSGVQAGWIELSAGVGEPTIKRLTGDNPFQAFAR